MAQAPSPTGPQVGCFRGRPLPACRSLWIFEEQASTPLVQSERRIDVAGGPSPRVETFETVLEWNLGHMANLTRTLALGGVVTLGTGSDGPLTGVKLRVRRWLSPDVSLELEGGLLRTNARDNRFPAATGGTSDLRVNVRDQGSFYLRWDGVVLPDETYPVNGYHDPGGFQQALSVGVGLGSKPALVGTGATGVMVVALIVALARTLE